MKLFTTPFVEDLQRKVLFIYLFLRRGYSALSTIKTNRSTKDSVEGLFLGSYKIVASLGFIVHPLLLLPFLFVYMQSKILMFWYRRPKTSKYLFFRSLYGFVEN